MGVKSVVERSSRLVKLRFNGDPAAEARQLAICLINRNYFPRVSPGLDHQSRKWSTR